MPFDPDRRKFMSEAASLSLGMGIFGMAQSGPGTLFKPGRGPLFDISLAQWSLHRSLRARGANKLDNLDFAATARKLDINAIEYVNSFFKNKAGDNAYLTQMKDRAKSEGVKSLLIMVDGEGQLGNPDKKKRAKAVEQHRKWVEAAAFLGCHSIRVNAASSGSYDEQMRLARDGLRQLTEIAAKFKIHVIVENHGGLSSNGMWLSHTIARVKSPWCGTLPDFGNFNLPGGKKYDRYKGVKELMPEARAVSAKSYDFDDKGNETTIDFEKMMRIVADAGYRGYVGIEYEGGRLGELDGIRATKKLLERVRSKLAPEYK